MSERVATFGAGCFWGVEKRFREVPGVLDVTVGYMGGELDNPTYRDVCSGRTGHAEVAQVQFDDSRVEYGALLDSFFAMHDPTTRNRQGPDIGSQYRSVIFTHDAGQERAAREAIDKLEQQGRHARPVVTQVVPAAAFWRAEEYHQRYLEKNAGASCHL